MEKGEKIRVLRIINRFNIGGPTYNATFLSRFLSDDFETLLVGGLPEPGESDSLHIPEEYGLNPMLISDLKRTPNFFNDRKAYRKIKEIIKDFKPHIVHTHASKAGALGRKAAFALNVPVVIHTFHGHVFHSYFGKIKTELYKFIERRLALKTTGIIAISDLQKKELVEVHRIADNQKVQVIHLGFDLSKFQKDIAQKREETRRKFGLEDDNIAIAIIGRLAPIKNHQLFLDVVQKVSSQTNKKLCFLIVGDGEEYASIKHRIDNMKLRDEHRIVMTSWIKDIAHFNAGMDIICLTSNNEGTPVSLIEAQATNVPVVTTDVGGVRDIVNDGETAFVVPRNNVEAFAEKLLELINDEKKRLKMSQNGWTFVEGKFNYHTLAKNTEVYYRKLLAESKI